MAIIKIIQFLYFVCHPEDSESYNVLYKTILDIICMFKLMNCSFQQIITGFLRIFTTLIPSNKWWAWANKKHLKPPDWRPKFYGM